MEARCKQCGEAVTGIVFAWNATEAPTTHVEPCGHVRGVDFVEPAPG